MPSGARTPPCVLNIRTCLPPSALADQPMPAFCERPKRLPEGSSMSMDGVSGSSPSGPGACVRTPKTSGLSESTRLVKFILMASEGRESVAIYPGSFDPLTNGHLDLIARGARLFRQLIVAVLRNTQKQPLFSVEERLGMMREVCGAFPNVKVDSFDGLLVDYAARRNATAILRGIRAISDYEVELQMAHVNRRLRPETETIFLLASEEYAFVSSRMIKE